MTEAPRHRAAESSRWSSEICTDIAHLVPGWDDVSPRMDTQMRTNWLSCHHGRISNRQFYLRLRDATGDVRAAAALYLYEGTETHQALRPSRMLRRLGTGSSTSKALDELLPVLVCQVPSALLPAVAVGPAGEEVAGSLHALCAAMEGLAGDLGARALVVGGVEERRYPELEAVLRARGYMGAVYGAQTRLPVPADFSAYVERFRSHRRNTIRRERRSFQEAGCRIGLHGVERLDAELAAIQESHFARHGWSGGLEAIEDRFNRTRRHLANELRVLVAEREGRALGYLAFLRSEDEVIAVQGAFLPNDLFVYYNLYFYALVEAAAAMSADGGAPVAEIAYGTDAYRAKVERGCRLGLLRAFIRLPAGELPARLRDHLSATDHHNARYFDRHAAAVRAPADGD